MENYRSDLIKKDASYSFVMRRADLILEITLSTCCMLITHLPGMERALPESAIRLCPAVKTPISRLSSS